MTASGSWCCQYCGWQVSDSVFFEAAGDEVCSQCSAPLSSFQDVAPIEHSDDDEILE